MSDAAAQIEEDSRREEIRQLAAAANIDPQTLLATDYLNHFNEVVMLIDMVPDLPECLDDVMDWAPKSYPDHFHDSSFSDKELAIEAYDYAPMPVRSAFEVTVVAMDDLVQGGRAQLANLIAEGGEDALREAAGTLSRNLQKLIDVASAIIHGADDAMAQNEIDALLTS